MQEGAGSLLGQAGWERKSAAVLDRATKLCSTKDPFLHKISHFLNMYI